MSKVPYLTQGFPNREQPRPLGLLGKIAKPENCQARELPSCQAAKLPSCQDAETLVPIAVNQINQSINPSGLTSSIEPNILYLLLIPYPYTSLDKVRAISPSKQLHLY